MCLTSKSLLIVFFLLLAARVGHAQVVGTVRVVARDSQNLALSNADLWAAGNIIYGSGFLKGDGPDHMPQHTTLDLSLGKDIGNKLAVRLSALNVGNAQCLTGFENSFAGTHYANPREVTVQVQYKFHY